MNFPTVMTGVTESGEIWYASESQKGRQRREV